MSNIHFSTLTYLYSYSNGIYLFTGIKELHQKFNRNKCYFLMKIVSIYIVIHLFMAFLMIYNKKENFLFYSFEYYMILIITCFIFYYISMINTFEESYFIKFLLKISMITYLFKFYLMFHINSLFGLSSIYKFLYYYLIFLPFCYFINLFFIKLNWKITTINWRINFLFGKTYIL